MKFPELKIKRVSLAAEARLIRREELTLKSQDRHSERERLYLHRVGKVRTAARYAHLANAFMQFKPYKSAEQKVRPNNEPSDVLLIKELRAFSPTFAAQTKGDQVGLVIDWFDGKIWAAAVECDVAA